MSITGPGSITATTLLAQNNMMNQLNTLSEQLGTGQAASTYSGLGSQAGLALQLTAQLAAINGYSSTAATVGTTLGIAQTVLTQSDSAGTAVQQSLNGPSGIVCARQYRSDRDAGIAPRVTSIKYFRSLNTQVGDNYIFSGSALNQPSVATTDAILNGNGTQAGLKQVMADRLQADQGANGLGRLSVRL